MIKVLQRLVKQRLLVPPGGAASVRKERCMGIRKRSYYFEELVRGVDYACQSAEILYTSLKRFEPEHLKEMMSTLHNIEHTADEAKHDFIYTLSQALFPPLAREDIHHLIQTIDDVTDNVEDVLMRVFMFNIQVIRPEAIQFAALIVSCCGKLKEVMKELRHFRRSSRIYSLIVEINTLEEEADRLYVDTMRELYCNRLDPVETLAWTETFDRMEKCCDCCEHAANAVEKILMKNSFRLLTPSQN